MNTTSAEHEIRASLSSRLAAAASRKEKTRVAATILFFEHGIYPSAKTVHSYTQQGSMTDINADLREFWAYIREKARVEINAPFLPSELNERFSEDLARLWEVATQRATEQLEAERLKCREAVSQAEQEALRATDLVESLRADLAVRESTLAQERDLRSAAESKGAALQAQVDALKEALENAEHQIRASEKSRQEAIAQFSRDLDTEREARKRDAEHLHGEINFAKMQIEETREAARLAENEARQRYKDDVSKMALESARLQQRLTRAEDEIYALKGEIIKKQAELTVAENQLKVAVSYEAERKKERPSLPRIRPAMSMRRKKL